MHSRRLTSPILLFSFAALFIASTHAQSIASTDSIPDAPGAQQPSGQSATPQSQSTPQSADLEGKQTKRILGIIPNFRSVSADQKLPPQSIKEKFMTTTEDSFDYSAFIFSGILAGVSQAENSYPEFHQGAAGYGRYYWHTFADQTIENYNVEFIFPTLLHQDSRYYTLGHGGLFKRTGYSFSRVLITRTDGGNQTFNASEIVGAGAASGLSSLYYPSSERTWTKVGQRWFTNVSLDGLTFVFKEFWPDINSAVFHQKQ
ncbi:MAG TPA: hypothetical protein VFE22_12960 [Edaphobacter sp.]|nr:hypothetical protein [Edaphobacter sp.]